MDGKWKFPTLWMYLRMMHVSIFRYGYLKAYWCKNRKILMYFCEMVMEGRDEDRAGLTAVIRVKIERLIINTTSTYQTISHTINHLVLMLQQVFHNAPSLSLSLSLSHNLPLFVCILTESCTWSKRNEAKNHLFQTEHYIYNIYNITRSSIFKLWYVDAVKCL